MRQGVAHAVLRVSRSVKKTQPNRIVFAVRTVSRQPCCTASFWALVIQFREFPNVNATSCGERRPMKIPRDIHSSMLHANPLGFPGREKLDFQTGLSTTEVICGRYNVGPAASCMACGAFLLFATTLPTSPSDLRGVPRYLSV